MRQGMIKTRHAFQMMVISFTSGPSLLTPDEQ